VTALAEPDAEVASEVAADAEDPEYVGFITRVIAFAIDAALIDFVALIVAVVVALIFSVVPESDTVKTIVVACGGVAFVIWCVAYFVVFWTTTGQTPGSRTMSIRVVHVDGGRVRLRNAIVRLGGLVVSLPFLWGFVPILVDDRRRGVFDRLARTVVVRADRRPWIEAMTATSAGR
jgi:uncharacterized RDD family membrane protein YckC